MAAMASASNAASTKQAASLSDRCDFDHGKFPEAPSRGYSYEKALKAREDTSSHGKLLFLFLFSILRI